MMRSLLLCLYLLAEFSLFSSGGPEIRDESRSASVYGCSDIVAGISFPPFADEGQIDFTLRQLRKLSVDRIRIAVDWRNREPERGAFYWEPMDRRMEAAARQGVSVFLTIASLGPEWARLEPGSDGACLLDEAAFADFAEALLTRYDNIDRIQYGNEWEGGSPGETTYTDPASIRNFVFCTNALYDAAARLSPGTKVVLGGITRTWPIAEMFLRDGSYSDFSGIELAVGATEEYLRRRIDKLVTAYVDNHIVDNIDYVLANARYDMIDIHLYDDPENWAGYLSFLPKDKPIVVSEFGGPNSEFEKTAPSYQAQRMAAYLDAIEGLPILEAYYFKLVDSPASYHKNSGLFYSTRLPKPARNVFADRLSDPILN
ncbi:MAG: beta-galactosidase [Spirochaetales bacterium]|nr:beta-galactosidase [Spirochaetales bacterium]